MPIRDLTDQPPLPERGTPRLRLHLTPYKSLTPEGFVWFIGVTSALIAMPLFGILGTSVFWGLLPFLVAAVWGIWTALRRSWSDMDLYEDVTVWDDLIRIERHDPRKPPRDWEANPYWVRTTLHAHGGPVPDYLTLKGGAREVELGAFLTPSERRSLYDLLDHALASASCDLLNFTAALNPFFIRPRHNIRRSTIRGVRKHMRSGQDHEGLHPGKDSPLIGPSADEPRISGASHTPATRSASGGAALLSLGLAPSFLAGFQQSALIFEKSARPFAARHATLPRPDRSGASLHV